MIDTEEEILPESKLGTKQHWDQVREVKTFDEIGDEGEIWFGEDAVDRIVRYVEEMFEDEVAPTSSDQLSILDLGTGNGHILFSLLEAEIDPPLEAQLMKGVDYSQASIDLSRSIAETREDERCKKVQFEISDLLDAEQVDQLRQSSSVSREGWDLVCDKGTYDAIALSSQPINGSLPVELYARAVRALTRPGGTFLITSCNFTEAELVAKFASETGGFDVEKVVPAPRFTFGGQTGSTTTTIGFKRKLSNLL